eukprot:6184142-Pleurochrysis_carterae.AAC.1
MSLRGGGGSACWVTRGPIESKVSGIRGSGVSARTGRGRVKAHEGRGGRIGSGFLRHARTVQTLVVVKVQRRRQQCARSWFASTEAD